ELERIGDTRTRRVDVRVIAATNRDLRAEVDAGRFRQDLYYRLSVFPIELPPLRERRADIAPLAERFLRRAAARRGRKAREPARLSPGALQRLERYDWPGNVRELQNAIERALIVAPDGPLAFDDLGGRPAARRARGGRGESDPAPVRTRAELRAEERANLVAALHATGGKVSGVGGAAELLGMKPTTLASRLRALAIDRRRPDARR
ncbi:MAG: sigma 54-interacting transcriptional regulator, partial [Planctomycetes bacterium]|nr:sigma 54-interacting transcriptional regulator [Planctomycetota bacterium]